MLRKCKDCGMELLGRSDKKFCDDACRSNYHNKQRAEERKKIYGIQSILIRNRKLLLEYSRTSGLKCSREDLLQKGFNFSYFTHSLREGGRSIYYCYDTGYSEEEEGKYSLIID